jgi:hypothetical protein
MPRRPVFAGTWQIETNNPENAKDIPGVFAFDQKIETMTTIVQDFYKNARQYAKIGGMTAGDRGVPVSSPAEDRPLYIFVAPEYYFKKSIGERCVDKADRDRFIAAMSAIAQSSNNLLIVPGTVAWKKPADEKASKKAEKRLVDREKNFLDQVKGKDVKSYFAKQKMLYRRDPDAQYVAYNTAYLFYGAQTYKYHKMNDFSELEKGDRNTVFIPGSARGIYDVGGFKIGIEICGDHDTGMLDQEVDIHIVTSAAVTRKNMNVKAKNGGLFVHAASSHAEAHKVFRGAQDEMQLVEPYSMVNQPFVGDRQNMQQEVTRRMQGITKNVEQRKEGITKQVRMAYGGRLTTWMAMLDTI